ncbi:MAG: hypothetical protein JF887_05785 [Candidatus Dormibacteraeota bacterium]|uniref:Uncharacterized protein n=1 Tax=Candidatus Amunia macphersoniae TaxID=3127014 RepID=A0A934KHL6_9BACT|nr:hypothetical protein [Candidatus Dormibacteraeota bacterium]
MQRVSPSTVQRDRRRDPRQPAVDRPLIHAAVPVAGLVLAIGLELFEAPALSVLAAVRLFEALCETPAERYSHQACKAVSPARRSPPSGVIGP